VRRKSVAGRKHVGVFKERMFLIASRGERLSEGLEDCFTATAVGAVGALRPWQWPLCARPRAVVSLPRMTAIAAKASPNFLVQPCCGSSPRHRHWSSNFWGSVHSFGGHHPGRQLPGLQGEFTGRIRCNGALVGPCVAITGNCSRQPCRHGTLPTRAVRWPRAR
jgi:hypothetical protein